MYVGKIFFAGQPNFIRLKVGNSYHHLSPEIVRKMKSISLTLAVFIFIATKIHACLACSSNANNWQISGSIRKAKEEYEVPTKFQIHWRNMLTPVRFFDRTFK